MRLQGRGRVSRTTTKARARARERRQTAPPATTTTQGGCPCQACTCPFLAEGWGNDEHGTCIWCQKGVHHESVTPSQRTSAHCH